MSSREYFRSPRFRFLVQRSNAKRRGIAWEFTFESWWAVWEASGRWTQRGNTTGCFVMARFGDVGPYAAWNVKIIPHEQNLSEGNRTDQALPQGVTRNKKRFQARRYFGGASHYLGSYPTPELAHAAYLMAAPTQGAAA